MKRISEIKNLNNVKNIYFITTCGKIISLSNNIVKILKPKRVKQGYLRIKLMNKDNTIKDMAIHRLVALAYIKNDNINYNQVNHKDEIKHHNYVQNLEWCDSKYNNNYGLRTFKAKCSLAKKLTNNIKLCKPVIQFTVEGEYIKEWISASQASKELNLKSQNISACCLNKQKSCGGYIWKFKHDKNMHLPDNYKILDRKIKSVNMYTLNNIFIKNFSSLNEASKYIKGCRKTIKKCCENKKENYYGYIWKYKN